MDVKAAFKFCSRCSADFTKHEDYLECPSCRLRFYLNPKVAAGIVLIDNSGQILLGKRGVEPGKGLWDVFGGFVDSGENAEQAALRELKEETGILIKFKDLNYFGSFWGKYKYQDVDYELVNIIFTAQLTKDVTFKLADDMAEYKFFKIKDIKIEQMALNWHREFLQALKDKRI